MKKTVRTLWWIVVAAVLGTLAAAVYVMVAGIPGPLVQGYLRQVEKTQGVRVSVDTVRWTPWHHITADDVRLSRPGGGMDAAFRSIVLDIESERETGVGYRAVRCRLLDGRIALGKPGKEEQVSLDLVECEILVSLGRTTRLSVVGTLMEGWQCSADGSLPQIPDGRASARETTLGEQLQKLEPKVAETLRSIAKLRDQRALPEVLNARVAFDFGSTNAHKNRVWAFIEGGPVRIGKVPLEQCSAAVRWANGLVHIDRLDARVVDSDLSLLGSGSLSPKTWDVDAELRVRGKPSSLIAAGLLTTNYMAAAAWVAPLDAHLDLRGDLRTPAQIGVDFIVASAEDSSSDVGVTVEHAQGSYSNGVLHVRSLRVAAPDPNVPMPAPWTDLLSDIGCRLQGPFRADVSLGPAPVESIMCNVAGRITCGVVEYCGTRLEPLAVVFRRHGRDLRISEAAATLQGEGPIRTLRANGVIKSDGAYSMSLQTDAEPQRLAALLPTNIAPFAASLAVRGRSYTEATLSCAARGATNLVVHASIHATDVLRNTVPADLLHASLIHSNGVLRVDELAVVRNDGQLTGQVVYDTDAQLLSIDARSTAPPMAMARFLDPGLESILTTYRMEGPATIECKGTIGLASNACRELQFHVEGERLGWDWFLADRAAFDLALNDDGAVVDNIRARWCGGDVTGSLHFLNASSSNRNARTSIALHMTGGALTNVVDVFADQIDGKAYEGELSGQLTLTGATGSNFMSTATGSGRILIQDGYILSIPIFGGLSKHVSLLVPGLGYANQRDLSCTFQIRDGRIETSDAQLVGKMITIRGRGSYAFTEDLSFRVQVQFLKDGLTATVTRLLTSPLTKALEFELTGTTTEPRWRPVNTPDRLLRFFTENIGRILPSPSGRVTPAPPVVESNPHN